MTQRMFQFVLLVGLVYALHPQHGATCKVDADCLEGGWETCQKGTCKHKELWPMNELEMWGMIITAVALVYTNMGGLVGGGVQVPILVGFFKFSQRQAVPISNASICVGAITRFFWNIGAPHPLKNGKGTLVDHNVAMLMMPMVISGVTVGVILNITMPDLVSAIVFTLIYCYFSYGIGVKACDIYKKEEAQLKEAEDAKEGGSAHREIELDKITPIKSDIGKTDEEAARTRGISALKFDGDVDSLNKVSPEREHEEPKQEAGTGQKREVDQAKIDKIVEYESSNLQWSKLAVIWGLIISLTVIALLRGKSDRSQSLLKLGVCDGLDWGLFAILQLICIISLAIGYRIVMQEQIEKEEAGYELSNGDFELTPKNMMVLTIISFFGSMIAAFAGVGPGSIFVPALTMIDIEPRVAAGTGMYVTAYLTLSSSIQMLVLGRMQISYMIYYTIFVMMGQVPGLFFQGYLVQRTGRVSYGVFIVFSTLVVCALATLALNIPMMIHKNEIAASHTGATKAPGIFDLSPYCSAP